MNRKLITNYYRLRGLKLYVRIKAEKINYMKRNDFDKFSFDLCTMTYRLLTLAVEVYFTTFLFVFGDLMHGEIYI